jgi:hypothetical protein
MKARSHFYHYRSPNCIAEHQNISFTQFIRGDWPSGSNMVAVEKHLSSVKKFSLYEKKIENYVNVFGGSNVYLIENETLLADGG